MKKLSKSFKEMSPAELEEFNGGGFAYDAGRFIRFMIKSGGGSPFLIPNAITDWIINDAINEAANSN